jgi:hypothetical protein
MHVESRESVSLRILFLFLNRTDISPLFIVIISKSILFRMMASVELMALRVCVWDYRYLEFCPFGIGTLIRRTFFGGGL